MLRYLLAFLAPLRIPGFSSTTHAASGQYLARRINGHIVQYFLNGISADRLNL
jgi:hypothetical protein